MIYINEYCEIKEFLKHKVCEIFQSENIDRENSRSKNTKYKLPNASSFGWMPAISLCKSIIINNNQIMYIIPYLSFYNFLNNHLPSAIKKYPELFGTANAKDVISAVYNTSGYNKIGTIDDYQHLLINNAYCYFVLRDKCGTLCDKLFRLDLFRHIIPNKINGYDFVGGIMHAYNHCSMNSIQLSAGKGETNLNDIWDLPIILGKALFVNNITEHNLSTMFKEGNRLWKITYHIDPITKVYYLKTAFAC
ncbi:MAG: hypothetical protein J5957_06410 [Prevotella sp.]|nr:hypothetical protein [Prevotella sp.]